LKIFSRKEEKNEEKEEKNYIKVMRKVLITLLRRNKLLSAAVFALALLLCLTSPALAAAEIMPLDEVQPGDSGYGRTVVRGMEIEEFDFEVIDILYNFEPGRDFILAKLGGELIEETGGVASGMSGSPLYLDERIIGAVSYGWLDSDSRYILATPIEPMLELLEDPTAELEPVEELPELSLPLSVSGLSGRRLEYLEENLKNYFSGDFKVVPGGDDPGTAVESYPELEPGSSVAALLARGDITIASIGTLTYIDDGRTVSFGHPFTNRGNVNFFFGQSRISQVIPGDLPFKLGTPLAVPQGIISQDRGAGISGELDVFPHVVPLEINVYDEDRDENTTLNIQIIRDEELLLDLPPILVLQAIDTGLDRIGPGVASTSLSIMGNNIPGTIMSRDNMYYSQQDIAARSLDDLLAALEIINFNTFVDPGLFDISFDIEVREEDQVALIDELEIQNEGEIYPGDELDLKISLRPYRQESFEFEMMLELPEDMDPGPSTLSARSGQTYGQLWQTHYYDDYDPEDELTVSAAGYQGLDEMIEDFLESPKNNEMVLEVFTGFPAAPSIEEVEEVEEEEETEEGPPENGEEERTPSEEEVPEEDLPPEEEKIREIISTDYVLEGDLYLDFMIEDPDREEDEERLPEEPEEDDEDDENDENGEDGRDDGDDGDVNNENNNQPGNNGSRNNEIENSENGNDSYGNRNNDSDDDNSYNSYSYVDNSNSGMRSSDGSNNESSDESYSNTRAQDGGSRGD